MLPHNHRYYLIYRVPFKYKAFDLNQYIPCITHSMVYLKQSQAVTSNCISSVAVAPLLAVLHTNG